MNDLSKDSRMFARKSLESNIVGLNRFYEFREAKISAWRAALLLHISISSKIGYVFCY